MASDVTLTIDGLQVTVPAGTLLVEAAKLVRTDIPVYCYHPKLGPAGLCRICLVDVEKMPKLQIACNTVATEGMVVHTQSGKAGEGRRAVLEFLLLNHPLDCPICDKGGECDLQDFAMAYGRGYSRLADPKQQKPKAVDLGPTIVLDEERCVVCQRCSRFDDLITHERSLVVKDRGHNDVIATATGAPYRSNFSGNVTELCPVGALTSKTYRFKSRPWDLHRTQTVCTQCSAACAINVDVRHGDILRTMSVADDPRSDGWLCDRGRYNVGFYRDGERLRSPLLRDGDSFTQIGWDDAIGLWANALRSAIENKGPAAAGAIGGGRLLNEEAFLLQHVFRALGVQNLDWRAGRQFTATPPSSGTFADLENAQTIVVVGRPPSQSAPVLDLRLRKAVERRGAKLFVLGPFASGSFVSETRIEHAGDLPEAARDAERIAVVYDGIDAANFSAVMAAFGGKTVATFLPGEQPNARGAEAMGMLPRDGGLHAHAMFGAARDGKLDVLSLFGVNPLLHLADRELARAALAVLPFSVVTDLFLTETAQMATLVLPALGAFEKEGQTTDLTGGVQALSAAFEALPGALSDAAILTALAAELGVAIPSPSELAELARLPQPVEATRVPALTAPPNGSKLTLAFATDIFAGGGTVHHDERLAALRPEATATLGPGTARALDVNDGDSADVAADGEAVLRDVTLRIDPASSEGTLVLVDGLPASPANAFAPGVSAELVNIRSTARDEVRA